MSSTVVAMLDLEDRRLHAPSSEHLVTACGAGPLELATVGPLQALRSRAASICPTCWPIVLEPAS